MKNTIPRLLCISGCLATGGAERFISTLLCETDRHIIAPALCLLEDRIEYHLPADIPIFALPASADWRYIRRIRHIRRAIATFHPDIVLSNIALTNRLTGIALQGLAGRPRWIARIGNHPARGGRSGLRNRINICWNALSYRKADLFTVNSTGLQNAIETTHPFTRDRTKVLYNPIDFESIHKLAGQPAPLKKPDDRFLLISAGRFHRQKRFDLLIAAFSRIAAQLPCELWICGDGYLRTEIEQDIRRFGLESKVRLLGHLANPFSLFRLADVFLFTSDWEGMPNALIEAMSLDVPAVSTDCEFGPGEIIEHAVSGMLVPPGDAEGLAASCLSLLQRNDREAIGKRGGMRVREMFDLKTLMARWSTAILDNLAP